MSLSLCVQPNVDVLTDFSVKDLFGNAENERVYGIKNEQRRKESLAGLVALKKALVSEAPRELFRDEKGRPHFLPEENIDFSISHSGSLSVAAVVDLHGGRVGVDIELVRADREEANRRIANRYFTKQEIALVSNDCTQEEFYRVWTEKEALAKMSGVGLSVLIAGCDITKEYPNITVYRFALAYGEEKYLLTLCANVDCEVEIINEKDVSVSFIDKKIFERFLI